MPVGVYNHFKIKGKPSWNKGLTKETDSRVAECAKNLEGKHPSEESKHKNREAHIGITKEINPNLTNGRKGLTKETCFSIAQQAKKLMGRNKYNNLSIAAMAEKLTGRKQSEESNKKRSKTLEGRNDGENNPGWKGGISFLPYPINFNEKLKELIRQRDVVCQRCSKTEEENGCKLTVHHIDYIKENLNLNNLLALCRSCNGKVNSNRKYWTEFFQLKLKETVAV
jgi:hypothetical protein